MCVCVCVCVCVCLASTSLVGVLVIPDAQEEDSGTYICTASGVRGSFTLTIIMGIIIL